MFTWKNKTNVNTIFNLITYKEYSQAISQISGPSCSKLMMSLVNNSLKFTLSDTQIC